MAKKNRPTNLRKLLKPYMGRLKLDSFIQACFAALAAGAAASLVAIAVMRLFGVSAKWWLMIVLMAAAALTAGILSYVLVYRLSYMQMLRKVDAAGLESRLITMRELLGDKSYIARKQREDTLAAIAALRPRAISLHIPLVAAALALGLTLGTTVAAMIPNEERSVTPPDAIFDDWEPSYPHIDEMLGMTDQIIENSTMSYWIGKVLLPLPGTEELGEALMNASTEDLRLAIQHMKPASGATDLAAIHQKAETLVGSIDAMLEEIGYPRETADPFILAFYKLSDSLHEVTLAYEAGEDATDTLIEVLDTAEAELREALLGEVKVSDDIKDKIEDILDKLEQSFNKGEDKDANDQAADLENALDQLEQMIQDNKVSMTIGQLLKSLPGTEELGEALIERDQVKVYVALENMKPDYAAFIAEMIDGVNASEADDITKGLLVARLEVLKASVEASRGSFSTIKSHLNTAKGELADAKLPTETHLSALLASRTATAALGNALLAVDPDATLAAVEALEALLDSTSFGFAETLAGVIDALTYAIGAT
ncbi:MAG: hypothetical protein IJC29_03740, partial [Clostridia bacterium]|nr:hypothetical protein [Clostridia bacterium]